MAKVSTRTPPIVSLYFCQEPGDPDYGSCLWAVFNFDLERYEMSITSDCGNYAYGWVPTHKSESFMHLMSRIDSSYLLDKISDPYVIDTEATFEKVKDLMETMGVDFAETDYWGGPVFDMNEIKNCCDQSTEQDVYDALERQLKGTSMEDCEDYDLWCCIQKDFPANAKKIVQVFMDYIQPQCKELSQKEALPTDLAPIVYAQWEWRGNNRGYFCSNCGGGCLLNYESDWHESDYCPHCGAIMGLNNTIVSV